MNYEPARRMPQWPVCGRGSHDPGWMLATGAEYNIDLIPFDDDLLSMEISSSFKVRVTVVAGARWRWQPCWDGALTHVPGCC